MAASVSPPPEPATEREVELRVGAKTLGRVCKRVKLQCCRSSYFLVRQRRRLGNNFQVKE